MSDAPDIRGCALVADDDPWLRRLVELTLRRLGYRVLSASNGVEAVGLFDQEAPDLVFLDVNMPEMNGYDASARIRQAAGERWVPIVFLTAATEDEALIRCVAAGGDDFLSKPFSSKVLAAKITALDRIRALHGRVQEQNLLLARKRLELVREQEEARALFERLARSGEGHGSTIRQYRSVATVFSGDVLLSAWSPSGMQFVFLGDFTGHGLPAALCAIPLAETFYSMTARGCTGEELVRQIDTRMRQVLPDHMFLAACLGCVDRRAGRITMWNSGLPAPLVWREGAGVVHRFPSRYLPLGIDGTEPPSGDPDEFRFEPDDRIYLYSDGLIEAANPVGEMFGAERVDELLGQGDGGDTALLTLTSAMETFRDGHPLEDDVTAVELRCGPAEAAAGAAPADGGALSIVRSSLELGPDAIRRFDAVSWVQDLLADVEGLAAPVDLIGVAMAELFSNALDHGLLGLDSALKRSPEGFTAYYDLRARALAELRSGRIAVELTCALRQGRWCLTLRMADTGPGFDHAGASARVADGAGLAGRGIMLIRGICDRLSYYGCGNTVIAELSWPLPAAWTRVVPELRHAS